MRRVKGGMGSLSEALCRSIVAAGLNDIHYIVQAMTSSIAGHGATLAPLMREAGFRYVFLGIENILEDDLTFLKASAKNADRRQGRTVGNATLQAVDILHRHGMFVVGGLIIGNPDDTRESIERNLTFARRYVAFRRAARCMTSSGAGPNSRRISWTTSTARRWASSSDTSPVAR